MNNPQKTLAPRRSSDSGTRPKVASQKPNTVQLDDEFSAFFDRGDKGDYEGGAAYAQEPKSLEPAVLTEAEPFEPTAPDVSRAAAQRARRALFTKVVASVVVGCAGFLLIAMGFKARAERKAPSVAVNTIVVPAALAQGALQAPDKQAALTSGLKPGPALALGTPSVPDRQTAPTPVSESDEQKAAAAAAPPAGDSNSNGANNEHATGVTVVADNPPLAAAQPQPAAVAVPPADIQSGVHITPSAGTTTITRSPRVETARSRSAHPVAVAKQTNSASSARAAVRKSKSEPSARQSMAPMSKPSVVAFPVE